MVDPDDAPETRRILLAIVVLAGLAVAVAIDGSWHALLPVALTAVGAIYILRDGLPGRTALGEQPVVIVNEPAPYHDDVFDHLPVPALLLERDLNLVAANAEAVALFGSSPKGAPLAVVLRHPAALATVHRALEGDCSATCDLTLTMPVERQFKLDCRPLGPQGRLLLTLHDETVLRQAERMRSDFVANVSHELRTPLATLTGFIETLQDKAGEDTTVRKRFLAIMATEAGRMDRLIDDLLSLSRIERDKHVPPVTPIALEPVIRTAASALELQFSQNNRSLAIDCPPDLPAIIADRDQIVQVLQNLLSNALKYGAPDTPVTLTATADGAHVRISVVDQGNGIAPEHLPRLTERFYRVDTARSRDAGGTGLGLAIVKHIVERHRGTLVIDSRVGEGTTVLFTLPVAVSQN